MIKKILTMSLVIAAFVCGPSVSIGGNEQFCEDEIRSAISESGVTASALRSDYSALRRASSQIRRLARRGGDVGEASEILFRDWSCTYTQDLLSRCQGRLRVGGEPEELPGVCDVPQPQSIEELVACANQVTQQVRSSISETRKYQRQLRSLLRTAMRGGCEGIELPHAPVWCQLSAPE